ncbi:MAG TPA: low molecular weight protein-tyrosine-phosphatase [Anaeromyxobacteraceae bacterium]
MFSRVLMVCTGNICRSPMAEVLLARRLRERGVAADVESAGISALVGRPAERHAQELMRERGLDLSRHLARQLTPELLREFELVLVMEAGQQRVVESMWPAARGRVHPIGRMGGFDVPDPFRQERPAFERALALIERGLADLEKAFWSPRP